MKNTFKIITAFLVVAGLWSCESEDNFRYLTQPDAAFTFITPDAGSSILLTEDTGMNVAATFTWEAVSFGEPTAITYTVQAAKNGTEFANPYVLGTSQTTSFSISGAELNAAALEVGLLAEVEGAIDVRIVATVGTTGAEPAYSDVLTLLVTPYPSNVMRQLYLVGAATGAGWSNDNNNFPMFRDPDDSNKYYFVGKFNGDQFKLLEKLGFWQPQWGTNDGSTLAVNDGTGSDPGTFNAPAAGYYTFQVNLADSSFNLQSYDESGAGVYATVGIIGTATAGQWASSTAMVQDTFDPHKWMLTGVELTDGEMKFRANNDWGVNWGANTAISGDGEQNGPNIPVEAGFYNIYFNDLDGRYILIPVE